MKKNEFLINLKTKNIFSKVYSFEFESITDAPFVMGCIPVGDLWKIFKTTERTGHYIIKEFTDEDSAFDYFYELCLLEKQREES